MIRVNRQVLVKLHVETLVTVPAMTPDAYSSGGEAAQLNRDGEVRKDDVAPPELLVSKEPEWSVRLGVGR